MLRHLVQSFSLFPVRRKQQSSHSALLLCSVRLVWVPCYSAAINLSACPASMRRLIVVVLVALLPAVLTQHVSLQLEHALDGARFTPAGRIFGNLEVEEVSPSFPGTLKAVCSRIAVEQAAKALQEWACRAHSCSALALRSIELFAFILIVSTAWVVVPPGRLPRWHGSST